MLRFIAARSKSSMGTGDWSNAGSGTRPKSSGTRPSTFIRSGIKRSGRTPSWPGGRRTRSVSTRRPSATWTEPFVTSSPPRRASGKEPGLPQAQEEGPVSGFLPLQHRGDALLGDHGHPPQAGHPPHPRNHRGPGSQAGSGKGQDPFRHRLPEQRWFVSFTVEVDRDLPDRHPRPGTAVGVDVGLKALVTAVDHRGRVIQVPGPRPLRTALRRLRRACRAHSRSRRVLPTDRRACVDWRGSMPGSPTAGAPHEASFVGTPGGWLEAFPTVPSVSCAGSSTTRPAGRAASSSWPTESSPAPRPARPVGW
jgi:hypothetical protein